MAIRNNKLPLNMTKTLTAVGGLPSLWVKWI